MDEELLVEEKGRVTLVTINRPGCGNALDSSVLESLEDALGRLGRETVPGCVVLRGAGEKAFSCGMDLAMMSAMSVEQSLHLLGEAGLLRRVLLAIEELTCPVVAAIRGYAVGVALELALACDLRVASASCMVGMPAARVGMVYSHEGLARLIRTVGLSVTRKLILTGSYFGAEEALSMGLVDCVVDEEGFDEYVLGTAGEIAGNAPLSAKGHKRSINLLADRPCLSEGESLELASLGRAALDSTDAAEGLRAFQEKREPRFTGG